MSLQRFLFEAAMSGSAAQSAERRQAAGDAQRARIVLDRMANNVNQLAKWANTNHVLPDAFDGALDEVRRATAGAGRDDRAAPGRVRGAPMIGKITTGSSGRGSSGTCSDRARRTSTPTSGSSPRGS